MKLFKYNQIFEAGTQSAPDAAKDFKPGGGYKSKEDLLDSNLPKIDPKSRIKISEKLEKVLKKMEDNDSYLAFELLWLGEPGSKYQNGLGISDVTISNRPFCFEVTISGKKFDMKIGKFFRYYWPDLLNETEIKGFITQYNEMVSDNIGDEDTTSTQRINVPSFSYNPKDVKATFLSLTTKTYPHFDDCRHEKEVLKFLPSLEKDEVGNYYKIIGEGKPTVMFTCHLDTADRQQKVTKLYLTKENGQEYIITDGNSILGADDKAGTTVMLYMMANNIPGLYYFFIGEERGGIGSGLLSDEFEKIEYLKNIKRCVSFDRRNVGSVITQQLGRVCCSNEFATELCKEYNKYGLNLSLDPTGIYTDSASFLDQIPECTNVSVGYMHEHTADEYQNITFLEKLCKASLSVNWNSLPTVRKIGLNEEIIRKHKRLLKELRSSYFPLEVKIVGEEGGGVSIRCDLEDATIEDSYETLTSLQIILNKFKVTQDVFFDQTYLKIELN